MDFLGDIFDWASNVFSDSGGAIGSSGVDEGALAASVPGSFDIGQLGSDFLGSIDPSVLQGFGGVDAALTPGNIPGAGGGDLPTFIQAPMAPIGGPAAGAAAVAAPPGGSAWDPNIDPTKAQPGREFVPGEMDPRYAGQVGELSLGSGTPGEGMSGATGGYMTGSGRALEATPTMAADAGGGGGAPSSPPSNSIEAAWDNPTFGSVTKALGSNASWLAPAAALGYTALKGNRPVEGESDLRAMADRFNQQGATLQNYLSSGTLPPNVQASINVAKERSKAMIRQKYASLGQSGSTAEMRDLQAAELDAAMKGPEIAIQLLQQGVQLAGLSGRIYESLMNNALTKDKELGGAIARFAAGAAGLPGGLQIKVG